MATCRRGLEIAATALVSQIADVTGEIEVILGQEMCPHHAIRQGYEPGKEM